MLCMLNEIIYLRQIYRPSKNGIETNLNRNEWDQNANNGIDENIIY